MKRVWKAGSVLVGMLVLAGCPGDRNGDTAAATDPGTMTPMEQMRETLTRLVQAQERHYEAYGRYTDEPTVLMQDHDFSVVGQTVVTIGYAGTEPQWEYLGTATHPDAPDTCEVNAGRRPADQQPYMGTIDC
jgi:hypothetical protein